MRRGLAALLGTVAIACSAGSNAALASLAPRVAVADAVTSQRTTPTPPETAVEFRVVLQPRHANELAQLLLDQQTPGSATYHHFLTSNEFARRFGATTRDANNVKQYFATFGLNVRSTSRTGLVLRVRGTAKEVGTSLDATLRSVTEGDQHRVILGRTGTLPAAIAVHVRGVVGLSTTSLAAPRSRASLHAATTAPATCAGSTNLSSLGSGYTVAQQSQLYGFSSLWQRGAFGVGQSIAIYELAPYNASDVSTYFSCHGLSPTISTVNVDGGVAGAPSSEATLDIEEAGALAPGAQLRVYQAPNNATGPTDLFARIASDNAASIVSVSWGICEAQSDAIAEQPLFQQMAAQGQTVIAATGDAGSSDCYDGSTASQALAVDDPSSQDSVTAVGGTYVSSLTPVVETVWNDGGQASGGGYSTLTRRPLWQVANGLDPNGSKRALPDLSVMADPRRGFLSYFNRSWSSVGGTSIGAPLVSALVAVTAERCGVSRLGFINPRLYQLAATGTGFRDITTGSNDLFSTGGYSAGPGYDLASGLGSPDPATFADGLCPQHVSPSYSSVTGPTTPFGVDSSGAPVRVTLLDDLNHAMPGAQISVVVTQSGALPTVVSPPSLSDSQGRISFAVQTNRPGVVTARVSIGSTLIGTATVSFIAAVSATDVTNAITALGATGAIRIATDGTSVNAAGRTANGDVVLIHGLNSTSRISVTRGVASRRTTVTPDISCLNTCAAAWSSNGHVLLAQQLWNGAPKTLDLQTMKPTLPRALGVVRLQTVASDQIVLAYASSTRRLIIATWNGATQSLSFVDRGASLAAAPTFLSPDAGRPRLVVSTSSGYVMQSQTLSGAWSASTVLRSGTLTTSAAYLDESATFVGRTSAGQLLASSVTNPVTLGSSTVAPVTIGGSERHVILGVRSGVATVWCPSTSWRELPLDVVASIPSARATIIGDGDAVVLATGSQYYLVLR